MRNQHFKFKQFTIDQLDSAFKVGTDGCLLGAWVDTSGAERILDIGTGSGVIALMLAQRSEAKIDAVELDPKSAEQAAKNFATNSWSERMNAKLISLQHLEVKDGLLYDLLVSNPPFFKDSTQNTETRTSQARHENTLTLNDLFKHAHRLGSPNARLNLVLPFSRLEEAISVASPMGWELSKQLNIRPTSNKNVNRVLLEWSKIKPLQVHHETYSLYSDHPKYGKNVLELFRPYYLYL